MTKNFMGKPFFLMIVTLLLSGAAFAQSTIIVKGSLRDSIDKSPVTGARIDLFSSNDSVTASAVTDKSGSFEFRGLHADTFRVLINVPGYPLMTKRWAIADSSADMGTLFIAKSTEIKTDSTSAGIASKPVDTLKKADSVAAGVPAGGDSIGISRKAITDTNEIKSNLISQLTGPVRWTQTIQQMIADGATHFTEAGPGKVLQGLVLKINKDMKVDGIG